MKKNNIIIREIGIILLSTFEIFLFSGYCRNLQWIIIGVVIHLLLLLTISIIISERRTHLLLYYAEVFLNYLLVFPMYNNWHLGIDHYLIILYQVPILLNYSISQNMKQLVILNINSIIVIGFTQRGLLLYSKTLDEIETEGVVTLLTMCALIMAVIFSITSLLIKGNNHGKRNRRDNLIPRAKN
jgi:hypothetical protein